MISKPRRRIGLGMSLGDTRLLPRWGPAYRQHEPDLGSRTERAKACPDTAAGRLAGGAGPRQSRESSYLSDDPTSWAGATRPRWSRPGVKFQRQACSDIWYRPRLCRDPGRRREGELQAAETVRSGVPMRGRWRTR